MTDRDDTLSDFDRRLRDLSRQQDAALSLVMPHVGTALERAKLCGGTALSRFHLRHRLSFDLDFFVPMGFDAQALLNRLAARVAISNLEITHDRVKADQLHFTVDVDGMPVKLSFVEDMFADYFPAIPSGLHDPAWPGMIMTEGMDGLYHRKLRTVVGWASAAAEQPSGGRQTARDMFDLFVLSQAHMPLLPFIEQLPFAFAVQAFQDGMANMPWFDLIPELAETIASPRWQLGKDIESLRGHLFAELGMIELPGAQEDGEGAPSAPPSRGGRP